MKGEKYLRFDVMQSGMTFAALAADPNYSIMPNKSPSKSSTKIMGSCFECHPPRGRFETDVTRPWLILDCRDLLLHDMFRLIGSWLDLARQALSARGTCVMTFTFGT
jgi:hypothetical protein